VSAGDAAAELVARHSLGGVVPPGDVSATAEVITALLTDDDARATAAANARALAAGYTWEHVVAPIRRWLAAPTRTRPERDRQSAPVNPPPSPAQGGGGQGGEGDNQGTSMDDTTRNDAVARLDGLWKVEPRPLGSAVPGVGRAKDLANSLTKWYVQGIVEQQNAFNAALVHAIQTLAANDDRRHSELSLHINASSGQLRQALALAQKRVEQVALRVEQLAQRIEQQSHHFADIDDAQTAMAEAIAELRELAAGLTRGEDPR
jgi:hypothetical protein